METGSSGADLYEDDPSHPIPYVFGCDVNAVMKSGGSDLSIVAASPLDADTRTLRRLLKKIETYLRFICSDEFLAECGAPTIDNTRIIVHLHKDSDPAVLQALSQCHAWVMDNNARLVIEYL